MKHATRGLAMRLVVVLLVVSFAIGISINVFWKEPTQVAETTAEQVGEPVTEQTTEPVTTMTPEQVTSPASEELSRQITDQIAEQFVVHNRVETKDFMLSSSAEEFVEEVHIVDIPDTFAAPDEVELMGLPASNDTLTPEQSGEGLIDEETRLYYVNDAPQEYPYETTICYDTEKIAEYKNFLNACYNNEYDVEDLPILDYYTNDEMLLARIIQAEAGGTEQYYDEPWQRLNELVAVGSVVLSRVRSDGYDFRNVHTITEVLYQKNQYAGVTIRKVEDGIQPCDDALLAAKIILRVADIMVYDSEGYWHQVGTNMVGQTGLSLYPSWGTVMFQTRWHYYANFD